MSERPEPPSPLECYLELIRIDAELICLRPDRAKELAAEILGRVTQAKIILGFGLTGAERARELADTADQSAAPPPATGEEA